MDGVALMALVAAAQFVEAKASISVRYQVRPFAGPGLVQGATALPSLLAVLATVQPSGAASLSPPDYSGLFTHIQYIELSNCLTLTLTLNTPKPNFRIFTCTCTCRCLTLDYSGLFNHIYI